MLERYFFILGLVNSLMLIAIFFYSEENVWTWCSVLAGIYLLLAVPAVYGIFLVAQKKAPIQYSIFLGIFLAFLMMEWLLDHVFKINFRENWRKNWMWFVPYLMLYYAMNYGFVVMPWRSNLIWGLVMMSLFVVQIITNIRSHPKTKGDS